MNNKLYDALEICLHDIVNGAKLDQLLQRKPQQLQRQNITNKAKDKTHYEKEKTKSQTIFEKSLRLTNSDQTILKDMLAGFQWTKLKRMVTI